MRGWTELCSDMNWEDYHGMWAKQDKRTGAWYVLRWMNLYDAMSERDCKEGGIEQFECEVKWLDLARLSENDKRSALECCGSKLVDGKIVDCRGEEVAADFSDLMLLESCIQYGLGAPLESFTGDVRPKSVRAQARRYAEECMRDEDQLREQLSRPVNRIGSTAYEYGTGDLDSAMVRASQSHLVTVKQSMFLGCPFAIMALEHYRKDGTCKCDDPQHRGKMIAEWGYEESKIVEALVERDRQGSRL